MKKLLVIILSVMLLIGTAALASCAKKPENVTEPGTVASGTETESGTETTVKKPKSETEIKTETTTNPSTVTAFVTTTAHEETLTVEENSPVEKYNSLDDAVKAVGFEIRYPQSIEPVGYDVINKEVLELRLKNGVLRKAKGEGDISGDAAEYKSVYSKNLDNIEITLKGKKKDKYTLAIWHNGSYSYSLKLDEPLTEIEFTEKIDMIV
ncbi:MAG: hypothetical protein K6C14_01690 [Eubacterium sp.]|nr:hypothetical protein [Eubacterium sp.]